MGTRKEKPEEPEIQPLTMEEIQRRQAELNLQIAETQLETQTLALEEQRDRNATLKAQKRSRSLSMEQKQRELRRKRENQRATIRACLHKMGGKPDNPLEGDGKSCLKVSRMLDGKTNCIMCGRCPLMVFTPHNNLKKESPKLYQARMEEYNRLMKEAKGSGLDPILGCTFSFEQDGVPILPEHEHEYRGGLELAS